MANTQVYNGYIYEQQADGSWKRTAPAQPQMPADPTFDLQRPQAQADVQRTQTQTQGDRIANNVAGGTASTTIARQNAPEGYIWIDPNDPNAGVRQIPGYVSPSDKKGDKANSDKVIAAQRILEMLDGEGGVAEQFSDNFAGSSSPLEYNFPGNPSDAPQNFDMKTNAMLPFAKKLLRTPGEGAQSDKEAQDYRDQLPRSSFRDSTNEQLIADLRSTALSVLANEGIDTTTYSAEDPQRRGTAWSKNYIINQGGGGLAGPGATSQEIPVSPEYQAEYTTFLQQWAQNPDPNAYVQKRIELDRKYGYDSDREGYAAWAASAGDAIKQGGATVPSQLPGVEVPLGAAHSFINDNLNNPVGAAALGYLDMATGGVGQAIAGDKLDALANESTGNALGMAAGQIGGSITGTSALGKIGGATAGRLAPWLLQGGSKAQFARNLAEDVAYSGIYGGVTDQGVGNTAATGAVGSVAGQGVGKLGGMAIGGLRMTPQAEYLRGLNIPMTIGQKLGGFAKSAEDKAMSLPIVGDMIRNRRIEGLESFNQEAFRQAGERIGSTTQNLGKEGVAELAQNTAQAYDNATAGVNIPIDPRFNIDVTDLRGMGSRLPPDAQAPLGTVLDNYMKPIEDAGMLTGDAYQNTIRALKMKKGKPPVGAQGFEQEWRDTMGAGIDTLQGQMSRAGGDSVVTGLSNADDAYRKMKVLEDAVTRARGGSQSGEVGIFTPSQLQGAGVAAKKKFPGELPFEKLADAGQSVLPSQVPNSGTTDRLLQVALPTALAGGGGAAVGYGVGGQEGAGAGSMTGLTLGALLAAGGTRGGQKALDMALISRPASLDVAGRWVRRNAGLFGSGAVPLALTYGQ